MGKISKLNVATLSALFILLTACGSKGGGMSAATPDSGATASDCVNPDPNTGFCGSTGTPGYIGIAEWTGFLEVTDMNAYRQYLSENNMCNGWECQQVENRFRLAIETLTTNLPGRAQFVLQARRSNGGGRYMSRVARAAFTGNNSGLQLAYFPFGFNQWNSQWNNGNGNGNTANQGPVSLRIITQFSNTNRTEMVAQVYYRGVRIGSGHMVINGGFMQFNQGTQQPPPNFVIDWQYYQNYHRQRERRPRHHNDNFQFSFGFSNGRISAIGNFNGHL